MSSFGEPRSSGLRARRPPKASLSSKMPNKPDVFVKASRMLSTAKERVPSRRDLQSLRYKRRKQGVSAPVFSSNAVMKGVMYKKRSGVAGLATAIAGAILQDGHVHWHERYYILENGVISYYKLRNSPATPPHAGSSTIVPKNIGDTTSPTQPDASKDTASEKKPMPQQLEPKINPQTNIVEDLAKESADDQVGDERGRMDLTQPGVQLRLLCGKTNPNESDGAGSSAPTKYQFELLCNNFRSPKEWQSWTICAHTQEDLNKWVAAITGVIYGMHGSDALMLPSDDDSDLDDEELGTIVSQASSEFPKSRILIEMGAFFASLNILLLVLREYESVAAKLVSLCLVNAILGARVFAWVSWAIDTGKIEGQNDLRLWLREQQEQRRLMKARNLAGTPPGPPPLIAGETFTISPGSEQADVLPAGWQPVHHSWSHYNNIVELPVRIGPDYKRKGRKAPSAKPLFSMVAGDLFSSDKPLSNVGSRVKLPAVPIHGVSRLPLHLILNFQIPQPSSDGPRYLNMVSYCTPSVELLQQTKSSEAAGGGPPLSNAARLATDFLNNWDKDVSVKERLKLKSVVLNVDECGFPTMFKGYNGKPVMVTKSATLHGSKKDSYVEIDVDMEKWGFMARRGINSLIPIVNKIDLIVSFVIQGVTDDELPEQILFAYRLSFPDPTKAVYVPNTSMQLVRS